MYMAPRRRGTRENDGDEQQATDFGASASEAEHLGESWTPNFAPGRGPSAPAEVAAPKQQLEDWRESLPADMRRGPDPGESLVLTCLIRLAYR
ncbi:hypothetical protein CTA2_9232 [Colletotrichum tanaceti]|nr:hypothetical protein CTA2_9232 [Colletotrichum tanaceti]